MLNPNPVGHSACVSEGITERGNGDGKQGCHVLQPEEMGMQALVLRLALHTSPSPATGHPLCSVARPSVSLSTYLLWQRGCLGPCWAESVCISSRILHPGQHHNHTHVSLLPAPLSPPPTFSPATSAQ